MFSPNLPAIEAAFRQKFPTSAQLYERAKKLFPSGVTHDGRYLEPFPVYVTHARGSKKVSSEGSSIIDYWVGHGSLLLGHGVSRSRRSGATADGSGNALFCLP